MQHFLIIILGLTMFNFTSCENTNDMTNTSVEEVSEKRFQELNRPQYHFTPPSQWMNDPNGMVFYEDEYHLFYQYYPDSNVWGPMHWGHAVSKDMVYWEHLPIGLYPDSIGYIFSGSAVIDWNNTSGFGSKDQPPMIAIFTYHNIEGERAKRLDFQSQAIAYSLDKGRTWTKYEGNPVIPNPGIKDFRDPKVVWDEDSEQWVMIFAAFDHVKLYGSPDLKKWEHLSDFGFTQGSHDGVWECPDLFVMPVEERGARGEETGDSRWVMIVSVQQGSPNGGTGAQYFIGDFDGKHFNLDPAFAKSFQGKTAWLDYGRDNYAGVTWSDIPAEDGRRLFLGWMSNWDYAQKVPTTVWRSAMTLARSIHLAESPEGLRVYTHPVKELEKLRTDHLQLAENVVLNDFFEIMSDDMPFDPSLSEMQLRFKAPPTEDKAIFGIELRNTKGEFIRLGFDTEKQMYFSDRRQAGQKDFSEKFANAIHYAPRQATAETLDLHLFFDKSSVELFTDGGLTLISDIFFPSEDFSLARLFVEKGSAELVEGQVWQLQSIW